jgi:hypothetical protein
MGAELVDWQVSELIDQQEEWRLDVALRAAFQAAGRRRGGEGVMISMAVVKITE